MSGETEADVSAWTIDSLRYHIAQQLEDIRTHLDERYATQTKALDAALAAQQLAMHTAFTAADKAVDKALEAAEKAVDRRQEQLDKEFHEHLEQVRHENHLALENADKFLTERFISNDRAILKAEAATDKRFESVNEFRAQLNDQAALFLPRTEYDARHTNLEDRVSELTNRINRSEGVRSGNTEQRSAMYAFAGFLVSLLVLGGFIAALWPR